MSVTLLLVKPMCLVMGRFGGFDVGVGSVHSQIAHASVVALVSFVPGAGDIFLVVLAATIMGGFSSLPLSACG